jgi:hypothetical protein
MRRDLRADARFTALVTRRGVAPVRREWHYYERHYWKAHVVVAFMYPRLQGADR